MKESLIPNPDRALPGVYREQLGTKLDPEKSQVYRQIESIQKYANNNEMKLNVGKCKFVLFNPTKNFDFLPTLEINGKQLETTDEMKVLGLTLRSDLS